MRLNEETVVSYETKKYCFFFFSSNHVLLSIIINYVHRSSLETKQTISTYKRRAVKTLSESKKKKKT